MLRKTLSLARHMAFMFLHLAAGLLLLAIALVIVAIWKFSQGPVDLTFAADYIKDSIQAGDREIDVKFGSITAEWPDIKGSPDINLSNFAILEGGKEKLRIKKVGLQIALLPLLIGKIEPETIVLRNPVIRIIRDGEGNFRLLMNEEEEEVAPPVPPESVKPIPGPSIQEICDALFLGGKIPDRSLQIFSSLRAVNITNAKLIAEDRKEDSLWVIPGISMYLNRSADDFNLSINYKSPQRKDMSMMNVRVGRVDEGNSFNYGADLRNADLAFLARNFADITVFKDQKLIVDGIVEGKLDRNWKIQSAIAAVRSAEGGIRLNTSFHDVFQYKNLMVNLDYDRADNKFTISNTSLDINGTTLSISADRKKSPDGTDILPVKISIPEITMAQIASLWPAQYQDTHAAEWLTRNLTGATLHNIAVTSTVSVDDPAAFSGKDVEASFDFENLTADYRAPLIPATQAKGRGTLKNDVLDLLIDSGKIGGLSVESGRVTITELTADVNTIGKVTVLANLHGPLATVFEYISRDPINLGEQIGLNPKDVKGEGTYKVDVSFPALKNLLAEQVIVKVGATLNDIRLPGIVRGLDLNGGPFNLVVEHGAFTIAGKGLLGDAPIDLVYKEYIDPASAPFASDIQASLITDQKLRHHFGFNIDQFISGNLPLEIHYKEPKPGAVTVDVKADLTSTRAFVEPLYFEKLEGFPGSATCVAVLKNDQIQQIKDLNITMGKDKASGGQLQFGKVGKDWDVKSGSFSDISLGSDNSFSLKFTQTGPNVLNFTVMGSKIDGRSFLKTDKGAQGNNKKPSPAVTLSARAKTMRTGDDPDQVIKNPVLEADIDAKGQVRSLDLAASIGSGPFHLVMKPDQSGAMVLKVTATDAGKTLRAFDIYDNMTGGSLNVDGRQIPGGKINDMKGSASIGEFRVVKAPALAQLINALSLGGVGELLQNKGISFSKLRTDFIWKDTPDGRIISLSDGRTSGASIGLSFGGIVNQTKGTVDISGTFVPMSGINKLVSSIPIVGGLLTGGKNGGIIAATYAMKGDSDNPRVFINPLSVLAPGFLRSILFEGGMDMNDNDEDEPRKPVKKSRSNLN
jgi:hypothetical protein